MKLKILAGVGLALALGCGPALAAEPAVVRADPWTTLRATTVLPPPRESGQERVGDVALHYAIYGKGKPVILLHPGLGHGDYWANQVGPLSQDYQVIVVDLRGHGRSTASKQPLSYGLMAEDLTRFIQQMHLNKPALVGWGDGAVVALEVGMRHPSRVSELILFGAPFNTTGLQPGVDQKQTFIDYVHKTAADYQKMSPTPTGFDQLFIQLEAMWGREPNYSAEQLRAVKVPTTIIMAEYDEWVRMEHVEQLANLIPDARILPMSKVSHFAPWQAPKRFNDAVRAALVF